MENLKLDIIRAIREYFLEHPSKINATTLSSLRDVTFKTENFDWSDGFNSEAIFGRVFYEKENGEKCRGNAIMVKLMPHLNMITKNSDIAFSNEIYFYNKILPFFEKLCPHVGDSFPRYYGSDVTYTRDPAFQKDGFLILENLSADDGYRMTDSKTFLDIRHLRLIVRKLANFHSFSYHAKSKSPKEFYSLTDNLQESHFTVTRERTGYINAYSDHFIELLSGNKKYAEKTQVLRELLKDADEFVSDTFTTRREPIAVLCHGDFLRNNLMVKYKVGQPSKVKFFDLANARYCSPVIDLALILYMNADQRTRDMYWDELIHVYCTSLSELFPDTWVPSEEEVMKEFRINALNAFLLVSFFLPQMIRLQEDPKFKTRDYLLPKYGEFLHTPWCECPVEVHKHVMMNVLEPKHEQLVLDVLKDIIDRGFV